MENVSPGLSGASSSLGTVCKKLPAGGDMPGLALGNADSALCHFHEQIVGDPFGFKGTFQEVQWLRLHFPMAGACI